MLIQSGIGGDPGRNRARVGESAIELSRRALELAETASAQATLLFRKSSRLSTATSSTTVSVEEAVKAAQWAARRAQLAAKEAITRANFAISLAHDGGPGAKAESEVALKSSHHARWLFQAAEEAVSRAKRLRRELDEAAQAAHRWSDDADDGEERQTLVERDRDIPISQKLPED